MVDSLSLKDYQDRVDQWIKKYGIRYFDEKTNMILLVEEVGELSRLIARTYGEQSFKKEPVDVEKRISEEIGDILFVLTCLTNQMNLNWDEIIAQNFAKKTDRDHERHFKNPKLRE